MVFLIFLKLDKARFSLYNALKLTVPFAHHPPELYRQICRNFTRKGTGAIFGCLSKTAS